MYLCIWKLYSVFRMMYLCIWSDEFLIGGSDLMLLAHVAFNPICGKSDCNCTPCKQGGHQDIITQDTFTQESWARIWSPRICTPYKVVTLPGYDHRDEDGRYSGAALMIISIIIVAYQKWYPSVDNDGDESDDDDDDDDDEDDDDEGMVNTANPLHGTATA